MALRGIKPTLVEKRFKAFFYGSAGVGKTTCTLQFPRPYFIDTERGAENDAYIKLLDKSGGSIFHTTDFDELLTEVKALLTDTHEFKTLVIDPLTNIYSDLVEKCALYKREHSKDKTVDGTEFGGHIALANQRMKHLLNLLLRLDMNVIITSHAKNEYGDNMKIVGTTFDCYKKLDHLFDFVCEVQRRGPDRVCIVKKTRLEAFPDGETFTFNYDEIANRYGRKILERDAVPEVLATAEQVKTIKHFIDILKIEDSVTTKWLTKANAETFEEMSSDKIQACIDHLETKIKGDK